MNCDFRRLNPPRSVRVDFPTFTHPRNCLRACSLTRARGNAGWDMAASIHLCSVVFWSVNQNNQSMNARVLLRQAAIILLHKNKGKQQKHAPARRLGAKGLKQGREGCDEVVEHPGRHGPAHPRQQPQHQPHAVPVPIARAARSSGVRVCICMKKKENGGMSFHVFSTLKIKSTKPAPAPTTTTTTTCLVRSSFPPQTADAASRPALPPHPPPSPLQPPPRTAQRRTRPCPPPAPARPGTRRRLAGPRGGAGLWLLLRLRRLRGSRLGAGGGGAAWRTPRRRRPAPL